MRVRRARLASVVAVATATFGCGDAATEPGASAPPVTEAHAADSVAPSSTEAPWTEEEVWFRFDGHDLFGIVSLPTDGEPVPAIVLVSGSDDIDGPRAHAASPMFVDHARRLAAEGFAVLRYDPPGVGRSKGTRGPTSLEARTEETIAALRSVASRPEVDAAAVGLQGWSQGPWVMAMTAARYPDEVAFLVSVVGSGQTVAEQQIYGIEAQSRAAGLGETDVARAALLGRLLIDWQLVEPLYREVNEATMVELGDGPWVPFADAVYRARALDPVGTVSVVVDILKQVQDEPWAEALFLSELYIPLLEAIPPDIPADELAALQMIAEENLTTDPADILTAVRVPVLAIFGEDDVNVDSHTSAARYEQYLAEAGNDDVTIVVIPGVGHDVGLLTPGYWELVSDWLRTHTAS